MGHSVTLVLKDRICLLLALAGALACSVVPHADGNHGKDGIWYGEGAVFTMGWKTSTIASSKFSSHVAYTENTNNKNRFGCACPSVGLYKVNYKLLHRQFAAMMLCGGSCSKVSEGR